MPRKFHKHKLLLDEGFHLRQRLPISNSRFDIKHVAADYKKKGLLDFSIYKLASKERRIVVTYNVKHFKNMPLRGADTGIIGVSPNLTLEQIDKKLTSLLTRATKKELMRKFTYISGESEA